MPLLSSGNSVLVFLSLSLNILKYVNDNYALVGTIEISENDKSNTSDKEIGLQLNTDQSGMIKYVLFDQYDNKLREDYIREAE